jgi:hypothetical protein
LRGDGNEVSRGVTCIPALPLFKPVFSGRFTVVVRRRRRRRLNFNPPPLGFRSGYARSEAVFCPFNGSADNVIIHVLFYTR